MTEERALQRMNLRFNANQLKLIAIIAMVVDHCAVVFVSDSSSVMWLLRMIGRMTAPIMCFFIAEGYFHTSNLKKYMGRLLFVNSTPIVGQYDILNNKRGA